MGDLRVGREEDAREVGDLFGEVVDGLCHELLRFRPVTAKRRKAPAGFGKGLFVWGSGWG
ncbi:hypothetical protein GCM10018791_24550 [Streptomyces zaomyceticus]|nr:hypothetical protein GCM10018791_24550 [Streptomyces zaomyceticus]